MLETCIQHAQTSRVPLPISGLRDVTAAYTNTRPYGIPTRTKYDGLSDKNADGDYGSHPALCMLQVEKAKICFGISIESLRRLARTVQRLAARLDAPNIQVGHDSSELDGASVQELMITWNGGDA